MLPYRTLNECIEAAKNLNPVECEGFVVVDSQWNRVKIKSPQYVLVLSLCLLADVSNLWQVALHHLTDNQTKVLKGAKVLPKFQIRQLLAIVRSNECDEFLAYYPELLEAFTSVKARYNYLCHLADSRNDRALYSSSSSVQVCHEVANVLHTMDKCGCSAAGVFQDMDLKALESLLTMLAPEGSQAPEQTSTKLQQCSDRQLMIVLIGLPGAGASFSTSFDTHSV